MAEADGVVSTKAVMSPGPRKLGLLAQAPCDPELLNLIHIRETHDGLFQEEPAQNSYVITRVNGNIAKILDPDNKLLWFRAQITGTVSEFVYAATILGKSGILFEGLL